MILSFSKGVKSRFCTACLAFNILTLCRAAERRLKSSQRDIQNAIEGKNTTLHQAPAKHCNKNTTREQSGQTKADVCMFVYKLRNYQIIHRTTTCVLCGLQPPKVAHPPKCRGWWLLIRLILANVSKQGAKSARFIVLALGGLFIDLRVIQSSQNSTVAIFCVSLIWVTFSRSHCSHG